MAEQGRIPDRTRAIREFLERKWAREIDYRLIKELWGFREKSHAVRFSYEWRDDSDPLVSLLRQ